MFKFRRRFCSLFIPNANASVTDLTSLCLAVRWVLVGARNNEQGTGTEAQLHNRKYPSIHPSLNISFCLSCHSQSHFHSGHARIQFRTYFYIYFDKIFNDKIFNIDFQSIYSVRIPNTYSSSVRGTSTRSLIYTRSFTFTDWFRIKLEFYKYRKWFP